MDDREMVDCPHCNGVGQVAAPPSVHRFILMRHDPEKRNHEYLYSTARYLTTVGMGQKEAVDIVEVTGRDADSAEYLADYQWRRLASGMEARGTKSYFVSIEQAQEEANRMVELLNH